MNPILVQIRRARRRLIVQRFLDVLAWCWCATLSAALVLIAVDKFWPLGLEAWAWAAGALAVGVVAAIVWTSFIRASLLEAAIELDHRFALKERVSSALALTPADRRTEAGEALLADAVRRVERIDVDGQFAVRPSRRLLLPLLPGLLALLVALLVGPAVVEDPAAKASDPAAGLQVKKSTEVVRRELATRREQAKKEGLKDAEQLFQKLEEGAKELNREPMKDKALTKLNDLSRLLAERRREIGGSDKVKEQLEQMKNVGRGPADKFAKAVSHGDFRKAADELKKLKDALENGKLDEKQKDDLAKQVDQMKQKLDKQAEAHQAAQQDLQQRIKQLRQAGQTADANKLEEQLAKLQQLAPQMQNLQDMAKKLGQCSKCLRNGNGKGAAKALADMQAAMNDMQKKLDEMEMLDDADLQLAQAKEQMNCPCCGGAGCKECQGIGNGPMSGRGSPKRAQGARPEKKTNTALYDSQVKQKVGRGTATVVDMVEGPNIRGDVRQQIQEQVESTEHGSTDPLTGRRMPRKLGEHAKEYFDGLREGK